MKKDWTFNEHSTRNCQHCKVMSNGKVRCGQSHRLTQMSRTATLPWVMRGHLLKGCAKCPDFEHDEPA